ncbi:hypothetical protein PGTUg99_034067 [Puccinia graminis f. sp. tritici]|nr:hypothetical protein PGTUg99_034067 [Puccinia graminis f. sp. tritici]
MAMQFSLPGLVPIIQKACSDDETDEEVTQIRSPNSKTQVQKYCQVRQLPWRSKDLTTIFRWLDKKRGIQSNGNPKSRQGNLPRIRRRPIPPIDSIIPPAKGLPRGSFDQEWLDSQATFTVDALNILENSDVTIRKALRKANSE